MYYQLKYIVICFIVNFSITVFAANIKVDKVPYNLIKSQIKKLEEGQVTMAKVDTLYLQRKEGLFTLTGGTVYTCPVIGGKVHAFVYSGKGNFTYMPPEDMERSQLLRQYGKKSMNENFKTAFFLFNDRTMDDMEKVLTFSTAEKNSEYESVVDDALDYILNKSGDYVKEEFIFPFLEKKESEFFYAHFSDNNGDPLFYCINPSEEENVMLLKRYKEKFIDELEVVTKYSSRKMFDKEVKNGNILVENYKITSDIKSNLDFSASALLEFKPSYNNQSCIRLYLYEELEIDSAFWEDTLRAEYYKEEDSDVLWIIPPEELKSDKKHKLTVTYHGDLLEKNEFGWISIKSSGLWFPKTGYRNKSVFDLTFHAPEELKLSAVGNLVSTDEEDDYIATRWVTSAPIRNASFNIGYFEEYNLKTEGLPDVSVYMSESGHNQLAHMLASEEVLSRSDMDEKLAADVVNSISLYENIYGKVPLKQIYVTEIPYSHGEAFPGLIHLSWAAFQGIVEPGYIELLIAHEVAHQWWGIQVDFDSYHDQWLSEAFSHYSGLRYVQLVKKNDVFFRLLDDFKEHIFSNRKYLFDSGPEAGPIWLGYRTSGSETADDYSIIVYEKGAWVLHMLRNMMLDLKTLKEDKYENMMKDFFTTYSGKKATTADFIETVEKHIGEKMDWFFNQWVYNTYYPKYTVAYTTEKTPAGKYKTTLRVKQENVPANYKMYVNVLIKFANDQFGRTRVEVKGNQQEIQLPLMPLEPQEIIFNDLNSVLAEVDYEKW